MLDKTLIEKALALTGKTMEDMIEMFDVPYEEVTDTKFSIEKFSYYLLSPEFIEKYAKTRTSIYGNTWRAWDYCDSFGRAIYEYQLGNEEPLTSLLEKI